MSLQPFSGLIDFFRFKLVPGIAPAQGQASTSFLKENCKLFCTFRGNKRVLFPGCKEDCNTAEIWLFLRHNWQHSPQKDRAGQCFRPEKQDAGGNICAVGVANRNDLPGAKLIFGYGGFEKVSELVSSVDQIFLVENTFGETPKKTRHATFEDFSSRAEQGGIGVQRPPEIKQVNLVSAGTMEEKKHRPVGPGRYESMGES
jgi:hypothetical protein